MKSCPYCAGEVSDTARACGHCGRSLQEGSAAAGTAEQAGRRCPHCREPVSPTARACSNCGEWLDGGRAPRRRSRRGLPVWAWVLIAIVAAAIIVGVTYALMSGRLGREADPGAATQPAVAAVGTATEPVRIPVETDSGPSSPTPREPTAPTSAATEVVATAKPAVADTPTPKPPPATVETVTPTDMPTDVPTEDPTEEPTKAPTEEPTEEPPAAADALPAVLPGRIAFPVFDSERGTYDVYLARPDGSGLQRVMEEASQPALSPDGQRLAFRHWRSDDRGIVVMNTYGGGQQRLSNFLEDALPSWSPDGQTLVFFSRREADRSSRTYQAKVIGGGDWELKRDGEPVWGEYPTWASDGTIVYRDVWPEVGLAVMGGDGAGETMILVDESATAPAVSPDGHFIALMSRRDGNWEVYRINKDGSGLLRLTNHGANDGLPAWSPDGGAVAFVSDRGGDWAVWAMTPDGQGLRQLFALPGSADGLVSAKDYESRGWAEERISWGP